MGKSEIFQNNLAALAVCNPLLAKRLSEVNEINNRYSFNNARSGEIIPFLNNRPLHSTIDPLRESQRLIETFACDSPFLIFLGLGAGFTQSAALRHGASKILVIDFGLSGITELMRENDYSILFYDSRFTLMVDPSSGDIYNFILHQYYPSLSGGIKTIPLRARIEADPSLFDSAASAVNKAVDSIASDYSVQAQFGCRWFSNIIRNMLTADCDFKPFQKAIIEKTAIVAAGPSLDIQLHELQEFKIQGGFIMAADTALPALLRSGIRPDAVVSIDCQHISYYHFLDCDIKDIPLLLDMGSPPVITRLTRKKFFFCGGHPLAVYIKQHWRDFPIIDTSGANVTYACLSIAENMGARHITLFGADFSYIGSRTYARGTYIYRYFEKKQNRLYPLEALHSVFLYRNPFLKTEKKQKYRETASLRFYRQKLEDKVSCMNIHVISAKGEGAPVKLDRKNIVNTANNIPFAYNTGNTCAVDFLVQYKNKIAALPEKKIKNGSFLELNDEERQILFTLLPGTAAIKHRNPSFKLAQIINETKKFHITAIDKIISR
ncbi:MAG: DUF115 domain-containing protein [Treponema sp.]|jgi:hypothetical protein|nr:DUF115 domain-containing protein [Treponema sp.]